MISLVMPFQYEDIYRVSESVGAIDGQLIVYGVPPSDHDLILNMDLAGYLDKIKIKCYFLFFEFLDDLSPDDQVIYLDDLAPTSMKDFEFTDNCYIISGCDIEGLPIGMPQDAIKLRVPHSSRYVENLTTNKALTLAGFYAYWKINGLLN